MEISNKEIFSNLTDTYIELSDKFFELYDKINNLISSTKAFSFAESYYTIQQELLKFVDMDGKYPKGLLIMHPTDIYLSEFIKAATLTTTYTTEDEVYIEDVIDEFEIANDELIELINEMEEII